MKLIILLIITFPLIAFSQANKNFIFQLNHIGICVDSITFNSIIGNKFITDTFSYTKIFKDSTGSEILILGKEHFLQFYPEKGFFKNRLGTVVLVHHTFRWTETNLLLNYLQSFITDSLYNRPYHSMELSIDYINVFENLKDSRSLLKLIPILQNYSKENYKSWGYSSTNLENGITQQRYMNDYVGKETSGKLFKKIQSFQAAQSSEEQKRITPLLKAYGYKKTGNKYLLENNPVLTLIPLKDKRVISIHIQLSENAANRFIRISNNCDLIIYKDNAWFKFTSLN